jgi:hypothetical protein
VGTGLPRTRPSGCILNVESRGRGLGGVEGLDGGCCRLPVLAVSAVVASGGRLASVVAVTTVVASDVPTSFRWLAKAFEPAAIAAASSVIRSSWVPSASTIRASPSAVARSISAAPSSLVRHA